MLTVALPIYQSSQIAWLAFDGLCNQINAPKWELIVCEEKHWDSCAKDMIEKYRENLYLANCVNITLIELDNWVNLPKKWQLMGQKADAKSKGFVLQAADDYSHPYRLIQTYNAMIKGVKWYSEITIPIYDLAVKKMVNFNHSILPKGIEWKSGVSIAFPTKYARTIPDSHLNRGIDHFLLNHVSSNCADFEMHFEKPLSYGLGTNSANNISSNRLGHIINPIAPFENTTLTLENINLPKEISDRLLNFELKYTNINIQGMQKFRFIQSRNIFKKGEIHELSEAVASLYLKEGIIEPLEIAIKQEKSKIETKELKQTVDNKAETMTSNKRGRKAK